jgi:putative peptide zinc metalloprotease protein
VVAAVATLLLPATDPAGVPHRIAAAVAMLALVPLAFECMVFMRTDGFFVLEDLTGCRDLHRDGAAYVRFLLRACVARLRLRAHTRPDDPTARLPGRERGAVRAYAVVLVLGTLACLTVLVTVALPVDVTLLANSVERIASARGVADAVDGAVVVVALVGLQLLWCITWWRRRAGRRHARWYPTP